MLALRSAADWAQAAKPEEDMSLPPVAWEGNQSIFSRLVWIGYLTWVDWMREASLLSILAAGEDCVDRFGNWSRFLVRGWLEYVFGL